ncbi:ABC transporter B family member [Musa troglodytarum]|uniref:ABC transporter B family member n=1 Tax=Musa troglodytarum TaxID=320322 RepID=A0A9E7JP42_9LILI|nr:ABC transporter B family member [Musa troglodytarum]
MGDESTKIGEAEADESGGERGRNKQPVERVAFYKLLSFADAWDAVLMTTGTIGAIGSGLAMPIMTFIFAEVINTFGVANRESIVREVSKVRHSLHLCVDTGSGVASFLQVACWMITGERQATRIRGLYLKAILRQEIGFFDNETSTGEVIGRMSGDTILIQDAIGEKVGKCLQLAATFFGSFVVAFTKGWLLSLVLTASIPLIVIAGAAMSLIIFRSSSRGQKAYAEAGTVVEHTVGSIRTVRKDSLLHSAFKVAAFNGEKQAINNYKKLIKKAYGAVVQEGIAAGVGIGCVLLIIFCNYGLAVWYGAKLIIEKGYKGADVFNCMVTITTGAISLGQASPCLTAFSAGQAAAYKMFETINRKPEIDVYDASGIVPEDVKGDVELKDVRFSYPARPDQLIFNSFSLFVPSGTTMALVGESGSGKSTVISLVERFYDPQAGQVLIDGIDLKELRLKWVREQIGLVSQEPVLFTTTIRENIAYGKEGATAEEIQRAAKLANAAKFIDKMPNGLDTMVGEHGTQLSGGQKQRIAIARVILKNPKILLLDEATSALDAESERIVQEALETIMTDRTTIVVAHRLSTIKNADTISVVSRGELVEQGSHAELIKDPYGSYSQLIRLQEFDEKEEESMIPESDAMDLSYVRRSGSSNLSSRISIGTRSSSLGRSRRNSIQGSRPEGDRLDDDDDEMDKKASVGRLAYLNKPETPVLVLGSFVAAINGVIFPVFGIVISSVLKTFYEPPDELRKGSKFWAVMFVLLGLVTFLVVPAQHYLFGVAGGKLIERVRSLSFERLVHQEIGWFDKPSNTSGQIGARLSADASTVRKLVGDSLSLVVQNIATCIAGLVIALLANWKLGLIVLVLLPLLSLQEYAQIKFLRGFSADAKKMYEEASQVANDAVASIRTVASFCGEQNVMDAYLRKCEAPMRNGERQGIISGLGYSFSFIALYCTYALCFYIGARFVHDAQANFTQVFRVFFALTLAALGVSQSSTAASDINNARDSARSIFAILDRQSKIDSSTDEGEVLQNVRGDIKFHHVSFRYPSRPHVQIFRDLCLSMPAGKVEPIGFTGDATFFFFFFLTVALVGESGSGKSTVIALLERFYDPEAGTISLDGMDIAKLKVSWVRQQMGLVGQEPVLFNGTIRTNIEYGKQGAVSEEELVAAAEAAGAHRFISGLPQGYDTNVGERGVQLSGGQKQRIAIARAVLKDPRVLLLDEATSALDAESERVVQESLDRVMVGRAAVVVAHRLSTIRGAEKIAVVKNGVVAEQGRHETLMGIQNGIYASLVALQTSST